MKPIKAIKIQKGIKVSELVEQFKDLGFNANKIAKASEIFEDMISHHLRFQFSSFLGYLKSFQNSSCDSVQFKGNNLAASSTN